MVSTSRLLGKPGPNEVESGPQGRSGSYPVLCLAASRAEISAWMAFAVWSRRRCNLRALRVDTDKVREVKCTKHHLENSHTAIAQMPMQMMDTASIRSASRDTGRDTSSNSSSCWLAAPKTCNKASTARVLNCKFCWATTPAPAKWYLRWASTPVGRVVIQLHWMASKVAVAVPRKLSRLKLLQPASARPQTAFNLPVQDLTLVFAPEHLNPICWSCLMFGHGLKCSLGHMLTDEARLMRLRMGIELLAAMTPLSACH